MRVLVVGPCVYPLGRGGYGGMEKLTMLVAGGMRERGHEVVVVGGRGSEGEGVYGGSGIGDFSEAERVVWEEYRWLREGVDVVLDFSHSHFFRRDAFRGVSWIWHDPYLMEPPVPDVRVYALSEWQVRRHEERTGRRLGVLDPICADVERCHYEKRKREGFFFSLGILDANKGQAEIAEIAEIVGVELVVAGHAVSGEVVGRVRAVEERTKGRVRYVGEVSDEERDDYLQKAQALIYRPSYPEGYGEAHSHKTVEALMMGTPCVVYDQGAMREVLGGYAMVTEDMESALTKWEPWGEDRRRELAERAAARWSVEATVERIENVLSRRSV